MDDITNSGLTYEQQVNKEIGKLMRLYVYHYDKDHPNRCYFMLSLPDDCHWVGWEYPERFRHQYGWNAGERKTECNAWMDAPYYYQDLNEAFDAARKLINGTDWIDLAAKAETSEQAASSICLYILEKNGIAIVSDKLVSGVR